MFIDAFSEVGENVFAPYRNAGIDRVLQAAAQRIAEPSPTTLTVDKIHPHFGPGEEIHFLDQ
jgi:hypothetical protein